MQNTRRLVIVGGGACGPKAAARARRLDGSAQITMITDDTYISYAACGLPYYIAGKVTSRNELMVRDAVAFKKISNVDVLIRTTVDYIDRKSHKLNVTDIANDRKYSLEYDKLVLSTGANPVVPPIPGIDLQGIHILKKIPDADEIIELMAGSSLKQAVIIGAGLIGMEMAETLVSKGFRVIIVEALDKLLPAVLDAEIADMLLKHVLSKGVELKLGQRVTGFEGKAGRVNKCTTEKESFTADLVILSIGIRPNSKLAREAGLEIGPFGDIAVNDHLQTSDPDIYAGGDCVANLNLITGKKVFVPLGSTANKHGHVIAANITGGDLAFPGVVNTACVKVFDFNIGRVGLGEREAQGMGYSTVTALIPGLDIPEYYPGHKDITIKLIVDGRSRRILGGQGIGEGEVIKRIDVLATAITMGMNIDTLADLDLAYAPPFNSALDILHHSANLIRNKMAGRVVGTMPADVKEKLDKQDDFVLLDVRSRSEWNNTRIESPQTRHLPERRLYDEMQTLPADREIITMCLRGVRAYKAAVTLSNAGFKNVKFMEGSLEAWCYECYRNPGL